MKILVAALVVLVALTAHPASAADPYRVCLDPGHGGSDPGALSGGLVEKELDLDIAQRVEAALLAAGGYTVELTRSDNDTALGNSDRAAICNAFGAQAVVSIHLNASGDPTVDYAWVFYGKRHKDVGFASVMDQAYAITNADGTAPLPHKAITNFANGTLLKSTAPAVLVEGLFMTNGQEQPLLAASDGVRRQQVADNLVAGIRAYAGR
jgi:N-acetylmuramoyl-L-alanine amidase